MHATVSRLVLALGTVASLLGTCPAVAAAPATPCLACHATPDQPGEAAVATPKLAGQYEDYLVKQLRNLRNGDRRSSAELVSQHAVREAEVRELARHFAAQPLMQGEPAEAPDRPDPHGRTLYLQGDARRNIPACVGCHGTARDGSVSEITPRLHGQSAAYLAQQLAYWRSGARDNSVDGQMNSATRDLDDADIRALARYLAAPY